MKTCKKGHGEYEQNLVICPVCNKEYRRDYYLKNRDKEIKKTKEWQAANRESFLAKKRKKNSEHPEDGKKWYRNRLAKRPLDTIWRLMIKRCTDGNNILDESSRQADDCRSGGAL